MNITRHNYEEYFILYMDNELGSDERRMVEAFARQHPDLKEELDLLLHYKLEPDTAVVFAGKEELMKVNGETPISLSNYEEWLVLYADNELTSAQRRSVEQFAAANPAVKEEMALMMKTKLQPEEIVFPDKGSLYRKEERRVVPFRWWRIAAAAIIILLCVSTVLVLNKKPGTTDKPEIVITNPGSGKQKDPSASDQQIDTVDPLVADMNGDGKPDLLQIVTNTEKKTISPRTKQDKKNMANSNKPVIDNKIPDNKKEEEAIANKDNDKPGNNLPEPLNNPVIKKAEPTGLAVTEKRNFSNSTTSLQELTKPPVTKDNAKPSEINDADVSFASLEEGSTNKKSRGLFRKIARTFEKRTNMPATDDNRLLVAGLSFKLK